MARGDALARPAELGDNDGMSSRLVLACFALPSALLCGCVDLDTAVFVDATIDQPTITVAQEALGTAIEGSFLLTLHLGARASGESEVSYSSFSLKTEDGTTVIESLPVSAAPASPVAVEPGGTDTVVQLTVDPGAMLLPADVHAQICAQPVLISAVIDDSLATSATLVDSEPFLAFGCE